MHVVAPQAGVLGTVPLVAATIPLAVGTALASRQRRDGRISVAFFGDGAMEEGHFHESVNLAAVYRLPVVFVCENNLYASHMHLLERRAADNLRDAAATHAIPGLQLDGNDVVAVYEAAAEAAARARRGEGPTLLEFRTYRWRGHVGPSWDMDVGVKRKDELSDWLPRDPVLRLRALLLARGVAESELEEVDAAAQREVDDAVTFARQSPFPDPSTLLDHVYRTGEEA